VIRRQRFSAAHPHVHVEHRLDPGRHWYAGWADDAGSHHVLTAPELRELLDGLDEAFRD
jgi:hypothetical protein